jgi:uncharacterized protein with HEPN domain
VTRSDEERFADILKAIDRCESYEQYLRSDEFGSMAYDAVLRNLGVIGEAVRALPPETRDAMPDVPWASIAGLRNIVVHEYFRVNPDLILDIVDDQLGPLAQRLRSLS